MKRLMLLSVGLVMTAASTGCCCLGGGCGMNPYSPYGAATPYGAASPYGGVQATSYYGGTAMMSPTPAAPYAYPATAYAPAPLNNLPTY